MLDLGSETLVITHDAMAQGVHFHDNPDKCDMADVAFKLVATNLSDLAAKGAEPVGVLLGYSLGGDDARFLHGLHEALEQFGAPLLGGDTISISGARSFGLTAIGRATHTPVPSRSGAAAGDQLFITGCVGAAMLGFEGESEHARAFNRPQPRLAEGRALAPIVSAMMDVSDGLLIDAFRLASASQCSIALDTGAVPVADEARRDDCMRWGDDYELLFTLPANCTPPIEVIRIGQVEPAGFAPLFVDGTPIVNSDGLGYQHA